VTYNHRTTHPLPGYRTLLSTFTDIFGAAVRARPSRYPLAAGETWQAYAERMTDRWLSRAMVSGGRAIVLEQTLRRTLQRFGFKPSYDGLQDALDSVRSTFYVTPHSHPWAIQHHTREKSS